MDENDDILEKATQELEESMVEEEAQAETAKGEQDLGKAIIKAVRNAAAPFLSKAQTSDLSAEKDRRGSLTESNKDPATTPKSSSSGYPDSTRYEARKGEDLDDDGDEDGDEDEDDKKSKRHKKGKKANPFMSKMKKMKKGHEDEEDSDDTDVEGDDEMFDATEVVAELGENVAEINKSVDRLEEGMAVFGELLGEMADPRRDKLLVNLAKAVTHIISEQKEMKKSLSGVNDLMKAVSTMPGVPKIAGLQMIANKTDLAKGEGDVEDRGELSQENKDRLFAAAVARKISTKEMSKAMQTHDLSILERVK
jgi:hypothetical protein